MTDAPAYGLWFLVQWPTLLTLAMCPALIWIYVRLARSEEQETQATFGAQFDIYASPGPAFIPTLKRTSNTTQ